ncbi:MAG: AAA family ATPase [Lactimicrobium sp.]|uniref:AAA family ATPase n=1 Tax=Lactimicrobium sp. TaxID=2563780 RepID=UPI002F353AD9
MAAQLVKKLEIDWNKIDQYSYIRQIPAFKGITEVEFHSPVTFFVGENGSGKSTLLEAIAIAYGFNPEGGTKNYSFSTYDDYSELHQAIRLSKGYRKNKWGYFLRAESFYNVATKEEEYAKSGLVPIPSQELHLKSHGESFLEIAQENFTDNSLYLLDEPEAALSVQRQLTLLAMIYNCTKQGSQFIIVSHSPILLGMPDAEILTFDDGPIHSCAYEQTDSYQITKMFIENRKRVLDLLLEDDKSSAD